MDSREGNSAAHLAVGVIGAGQIVEFNHLSVLKTRSNVSVAWLYDTDDARANLLSSMYAVRSITRSELPAAVGEVDICLLAVPYGYRTEYINLCAGSDTALYVEKPFATTVAEHQGYC